jgi:hypothetical protein
MFEIKLTHQPDGWHIDQADGVNIWPTTIKPNAVSCARRILQLLDIAAPVAPQDWAERVQIQIPDDNTPDAAKGEQQP